MPFVSRNGNPTFSPDHEFGRLKVFDLESTVLLRWMDETGEQAISEIYLDRREAWVIGALLQRVAKTHVQKESAAASEAQGAA